MTGETTQRGESPTVKKDVANKGSSSQSLKDPLP